MRRNGDDARDDDGALLLEDTVIDKLKVAHILPHFLTKVDVGCELVYLPRRIRPPSSGIFYHYYYAANARLQNPSKQAALAILNMFDTGVLHLIDGTDIDRPRNAVTLTAFLHTLFDDFQVFFEPIPDEKPHTYRIETFYDRRLMRNLSFLMTRTLYLTDDRLIDPPSPRLLAVHRAIAYILRLSGAGEYIDNIIRDCEEESIRADGSTDLDRILRLSLGGWLNKPVY